MTSLVKRIKYWWPIVVNDRVIFEWVFPNEAVSWDLYYTYSNCTYFEVSMSWPDSLVTQ